MNSERLNQQIKCPNCLAILGSSLSGFCPYCENALDTYQQNSISNKEMESLIDDVQENISDLKKVKFKTITSTLVEHIYISFPILSVLIFLVIFKFTNWTPGGYIILGMGLALLNFFLFVDKKGGEYKLKESFRKKNTKNGDSFKNLIADFEKNIEKVKIKYAEEKEFRYLIEEFNSQTILIKEKKKKIFFLEFGIYAIIILVISVLLFIPTKPNRMEFEQELFKSEKLLFTEFEQAILANKLSEAKVLSLSFSSEKNKMQSKIKLQESELIQKLDNIDSLISLKKYSQAQSELAKTVWQKATSFISSEHELGYDYGEFEEIEKKCFNYYIQRKSNLNDLLPKKHQVKIENWYDL